MITQAEIHEIGTRMNSNYSVYQRLLAKYKTVIQNELTEKLTQGELAHVALTNNPSPTVFQKLVETAQTQYFSNPTKDNLYASAFSVAAIMQDYGWGSRFLSDGELANIANLISQTDTLTTNKEVDLGLSVVWSGWNVGANCPVEIGEHYSWYHMQRNNPWGGNWRLPTKMEMVELLHSCSFEFSNMNGVQGVRATGPNGNSIFLPAAGNRSVSGNFVPGGFYWTGTRAYEEDGYAYQLYWVNGDLKFGYNRYEILQSVRLVCEK